ncbi:MAG TPA: efflux transporter outer membrane subunit [Caulobacteraceae bacterium]|jgi:NodT family efflux transporter outer membrane factor (OMF) lipoprotein|nr:efflux transporter outer membrane subunit [Caulobacteraceae bacterium]
MQKPTLRIAPLLVAVSALAACEVGPNYHQPTTPTPQTYRQIAGWTAANPNADAADKADWWTLFNDPVLNDLESKVVVNNQTLAADLAAYQQARALVSEQRAALFPTLDVTGQANVSHSGNGSTVVGGTVVGGGTGTTGVGTTTSRRSTTQSYQLELGATWEPDIWGKVRRSIENASAGAQATYADLQNARLSAQMELAADYVTLRELDEQKRIDDAQVKAYQQSLTVTQNKYKAGVSALSDVDQAETQLHNEMAADTALGQQRAQMEDAIAILIGRPADLSIAPAAWTLKPIDVPPGVPSTLLERRPDVAASERQAAAASANIGVATAGYYPSLDLTGSGGTEAAAIGQLFSPQSFFWNLGVNAAETIFNGGLTHAQVSAAKAAYAQAVANYRQTTLTAFGQVEDNLAAQRVLAAEQPDLQASLKSADDALRITQNEYNAGTIDYTSVVVAENAALSAHNAELQIEASRLTATIDLIVALGGGWNADELKGK